jgi:hypothetical protein
MNKMGKKILNIKIILVVNLFIWNSTFGQINIINLKPSDSCCTSFYKDGQIKSFFLKEQFVTRGYSQGMWIFYDSVCDRTKQSQNIISNIAKDNNSDIEILHYRDSIAVLYENNFKLAIYKDRKQVEILLHKCNNTGLLLEYNDKSRINRFLVHRLVDGRYQNEEYYSDLYFNSVSLDKKFEFRLADNIYLSVDFYSNFYIKSIHYVLQESNDIFVIYFYSENRPNKYGHYNTQIGRTGKWYTYYENGKLQSEGEYSGSKFEYDKEYDVRKNNKWIYYTVQGCIEKEEFWDNGKLIKTDFFDN